MCLGRAGRPLLAACCLLPAAAPSCWPPVLPLVLTPVLPHPPRPLTYHTQVSRSADEVKSFLDAARQRHTSKLEVCELHAEEGITSTSTGGGSDGDSADHEQQLLPTLRANAALVQRFMESMRIALGDAFWDDREMLQFIDNDDTANSSSQFESLYISGMQQRVSRAVVVSQSVSERVSE